VTHAKTPGGLKPEHEQFAALVASGVTQVDAFAAVFPHASSWASNSVRVNASRLARRPLVALRIEELLAAGAAAAKKTVEDIHAQLARIAFADLRELAGIHRGACRYCWGDGHRYHRTPREREEAHKAWLALPAKSRRGRFDEQGGVGFDPRRMPNPDCPECWGRGKAEVLVADTRTLSKDGVAVYGGVELHDSGEIKRLRTRDHDAALERLARVMGAFKADNEQGPRAFGQLIRELGGGRVIGPNTSIPDDDPDA